jgi:hypothetical protein
MHYLVTDQNNQSWRGVQWGPNVTNEEQNPNHFFGAYADLETALFMYPFHDDIPTPKFWKAEGTPVSNYYRPEFNKLTTTESMTPAMPTAQQRRVFAVLCSLCLVSNKVFRDWAKDWLLGNPTDPPEVVGQKFQASLFEESAAEQDDYASCAHACLNSIIVEQPDFFVASAAHRAYFDSPVTDRINLSQMASIAMALDPKDIAAMMF